MRRHALKRPWGPRGGSAHLLPEQPLQRVPERVAAHFARQHLPRHIHNGLQLLAQRRQHLHLSRTFWAQPHRRAASTSAEAEGFLQPTMAYRSVTVVVVEGKDLLPVDNKSADPYVSVRSVMRGGPRAGWAGLRCVDFPTLSRARQHRPGPQAHRRDALDEAHREPRVELQVPFRLPVVSSLGRSRPSQRIVLEPVYIYNTPKKTTVSAWGCCRRRARLSCGAASLQRGAARGVGLEPHPGERIVRAGWESGEAERGGLRRRTSTWASPSEVLLFSVGIPDARTRRRSVKIDPEWLDNDVHEMWVPLKVGAEGGVAVPTAERVVGRRDKASSRSSSPHAACTPRSRYALCVCAAPLRSRAGFAGQAAGARDGAVEEAAPRPVVVGACMHCCLDAWLLSLGVAGPRLPAQPHSREGRHAVEAHRRAVQEPHAVRREAQQRRRDPGAATLVVVWAPGRSSVTLSRPRARWAPATCWAPWPLWPRDRSSSDHCLPGCGSLRVLAGLVLTARSSDFEEGVFVVRLFIEGAHIVRCVACTNTTTQGRGTTS